MGQTVKDRLLEFVRHKGLTVRQFELQSGLGNAYMAHMPKKISDRKLSGITAAFPELNLVWLIQGKGEMINETPEDIIEQSRRIDTLATLRQTIAAKDEVIASKEEVIHTLRETIEVYRKRIAELEGSR